MNSNIFRCGNCGQPTAANGVVLPQKDFKRVVSIIEQYGDHHTVKVHGECCYGGGQQRDNYVRVTRDMAIDAGMPELEGQRVKW